VGQTNQLRDQSKLPFIRSLVAGASLPCSLGNSPTCYLALYMDTYRLGGAAMTPRSKFLAGAAAVLASVPIFGARLSFAGGPAGFKKYQQD
jgi:hypothetical protein